jgi:outer membrane protein
MSKSIYLFAALAGIAVMTACAEDARPLTLKEAQELAIRNHPRIAASELIALATRQVVRERRSAYLPHVEIDVTAVGTTASNTRVAAGGLNNPLIFEREADGVMASQLITDFGRTINLTASSKLQASAQEQNAIATRAQILLAVNSAYFATLEAQSVLSVAQQTIKTRQTIFDQINELAKNKLRSGLDVSFAKVDLQQSKLLLANAENDVEAQFASLATLLGEREQRRYRLADEPVVTNAVADSPQLIATALRERPDFAELRYAHESAWRFARAERGLNYPTISAVGTAGILPIHDPLMRPNYAAAGLNMSIPIFEGMLFDAREKEADLRARASAENLRDLEDNVIRDVRIAALNLSYAIEQIQLTEQLLASANESFVLAQARYKVGSSSIVELSQAQLSQTQAEISEARARYDYQIRHSILNFQTGVLK